MLRARSRAIALRVVIGTCALGSIGQDARELAIRGQDLLGKGQLEPARRAFAEAVRLAPARGEFHVLLGVAELELGRADRAASALEEGVRLLPELADAHYNLGIARYRTERFAEALESFRRAAKLTPENLDVRFNLALAEVANVLLAEARAELESLLRAEPRHAAAQALLGRLILESRDHPARREQAREHLERALQLDPRAVEARMQLGRLEAEEGNAEHAEQCFRAVLQARPDHGAALYNLGQLLWRGCRREEGRLLLEQFAELEASTREVERLRRLQRLAPGNQGVRVALAGALRERGDRTSAMHELESLLHEDADYAAARLLRARIRWEEGEETRALEEFAELARQQPQFATGREAYGIALLRSGRTAEGRAELEAALAIDPTLIEARKALAER